MKKHRGIKARRTLPEILVFGVIISLVILFISSLLFSGLIMTVSNPVGSVKTVSLTALLVSGAISGFIISKRKGEGGFIASLFSSLIFIGIILAIALIATRGRVGGVIFMNCFCYTLISSFFSLLAKKRERRHRR